MIKPMGKPMGKPGVKMAMGGTVQARPKGSSPRPGEKPFSPGMPKLPRIKMAMGGTVKARPSKMTLPPGEISGGPYRVPPKVSGGPTRLPPGMKPPSVKNGGMTTKLKPSQGGGDFGSALPGYRPGMKIKDGGGRGVPLPPGMKHGGMAHGTKAKKGRGMAIMIAIGKPKGRGK